MKSFLTSQLDVSDVLYILTKLGDTKTVRQIFPLAENRTEYSFLRIAVVVKHSPSSDHFYIRRNGNGVLTALSDINTSIISYEPHIKNAITSLSLKASLSDAMDEFSYPYRHYFQRCLQHVFYQEYPVANKNFTITKAGAMTFLPKGKESILSDYDKWSKTNRSEIKYGKGLRQIFMQGNFKTVIPDQHLEKIVNVLRAEYVFMGKFKMVEGEDIVKYYHYSRHSSNCGNLEQSCMKHSRCADYVRFYALTPTRIKMLIALDHNDQVLGRAIVYPYAMIDGESHPFMDRIYGNPSTTQAFIRYAQENNIAYKAHQNYHDMRQVIMPDGQVISAEIEVNDLAVHEYMPYMDTFKHANYCSPSEQFITINNYDGDFELTSTDGEWRNEGVYSDYYGHDINEEDARWSDYHDTYIHTDDACYVESEDTWVHSDDVQWDELAELYIMSDDASYIEVGTHSGQYTNHCNVVTLYNDQTCHINDAVTCNIDDHLILKDDAIFHNGYAHSNSYSIEEIIAHYGEEVQA